MQLEVAKKIYNQYPNTKILIMVAPTFAKEKVQEIIPDWFDVPFILLKDDPFEMIHLSDFVLVASGTATLQVGLLHKPMVIMYKTKMLTYLIAKVVVRGVKFVGLPNLILKKEIVPECLQASVETLFLRMKRYFDEPAHASYVQQELSQMQSQLGEKGATERVAKGLEEFLR